MAIGDAAPPLDVTLTLLAVRRGQIDGDTRVAVLARCQGARPGTSARLLVDGGHVDVAGARALVAEAQAIEQRAARIAGDEPLDDRTDVAARAALREGLLDLRQLRRAMLEEAMRGAGSSLATLIQQHLASSATLPVLGRSGDTVALDGPTVHDLPDVPADARRLGRYPVTGTLGAGGMGEVLSVLDGAIGREVAAKVIKGEADETALRKFVLEARVTGQLQHPSIVPAYELGQADDGQLFLTMKKVEGQELAAVIARVRDERRRAPGRSGRHATPDAARAGLPHGLLPLLQAFVKVCEGVAYAHSKGVIHRDLKPANIMVGAFGEVLVMDWGLAKITGSGVDADPGAAGLLPDLSTSREGALQTMDGAIMGTPAYMPPEQAEGQIDQLDQRADVYALGAILYEILALQPPYEGRNAWDVLTHVTEGPPPSPTARVDGAWSVPWELEAVVLRAMARQRDARYADVPLLAADIVAFLAGDLLAAVRYTRWELTRRFARRHWRVLGGSAVVLLSVIGALAYGVVSARREARRIGEERNKAVASQKVADARLAKAQQMGDVKTLEGLLRRAEHELWWTPLARDAQDRLTGELAHPPTRARLSAAIGEIAARRDEAAALVSRRGAFRSALAALPEKARDSWTRLQRDVYRDLLAGVETLRTQRRELEGHSQSYATRLRRRPDTAAWTAAAARIAKNPRYRHGLRPGTPGGLVPQVDLIPLGPAPGSGLEEFAHRPSGEVPRRGTDGRLRFGERTGIVFVLIPADRHRIGAIKATDRHAQPREGPIHGVVLDAFLIAKTEITQAQWVRLGGTNASQWRVGLRQDVDGRHPVDMVSWRECATLLGRQGLVLPTEVQWEAAARGGTTTAWWTGAQSRSLARAENIWDLRGKQIVKGSAVGPEPWNDGWHLAAPAGRPTSVAHPFGLHDMAGNVREWCRELYDHGAYGRPKGVDRQGRRTRAVADKARLRVLRGGCWSNRAVEARSAYRSAHTPAGRVSALGCRASRAVTH